ncbi:MAG: cation diffusion facilitator family transporter [Bacteroidota bacterium]|nr:cation diffusion facilitator family transporter [Candidatus Kapabacteria bacterium]MDW8272395.1 cation diffusion facilitator family transporter [Bacteroidota bacterium]
MNLSLGIGILLLGVKWYAYLRTSSTVILSDALESVVHQVAVAFAWLSLRWSYRPPDEDHTYGHEKIAYFSAGFEGGLVGLAGIFIVVTAISELIEGVQLHQLGLGIALTAGVGAVNGLLGWYLVQVGKSTHSLVVEANGRHILTDAWTSAGAVLGLGAALGTGWLALDPLCALVFGAHILAQGYSLVRRAILGLMDTADPRLVGQVRSVLDAFMLEHPMVGYHRLRMREAGERMYVDFHLQFPDGTPIEEAHRIASEVERRVAEALNRPSDVTSHLESAHHPDDHDDLTLRVSASERAQ